jgi:hypothetical protein
MRWICQGTRCKLVKCTDGCCLVVIDELFPIRTTVCEQMQFYKKRSTLALGTSYRRHGFRQLKRVCQVRVGLFVGV